MPEDESLPLVQHKKYDVQPQQVFVHWSWLITYSPFPWHDAINQSFVYLPDRKPGLSAASSVSSRSCNAVLTCKEAFRVVGLPFCPTSSRPFQRQLSQGQPSQMEETLLGFTGVAVASCRPKHFQNLYALRSSPWEVTETEFYGVFPIITSSFFLSFLEVKQQLAKAVFPLSGDVKRLWCHSNPYGKAFLSLDSCGSPQCNACLVRAMGKRKLPWNRQKLFELLLWSLHGVTVITAHFWFWYHERVVPLGTA